MISVAEALEALFAIAAPCGTEEVELVHAAGRVLRTDVSAARAQPPFDASAMDGYAVARASVGDRLRVIGESAAGKRHHGTVGAGEAVRVFTGAPMPPGAERVVIQEDTTRDGDHVTLDAIDAKTHVRHAGADFAAGFTVPAPLRIGARDIALLAAMNAARVTVTRKPRVAVIATGDELAMPGDVPEPDQIFASNTFGLHAMLSALGAEPRMLPIARDRPEALAAVLQMADDADLVLTVGGASVGDHDIVAEVAAAQGLERAFYKVAMRPGKPLMAGRLGSAMMIGLPGNPVSAMVCGEVFVAPVVRVMLGLPAAPAPRRRAPLAAGLSGNGPREHYMRACLSAEGLTVFDRQDSALLSVLGAADALVVRPPDDPPRSPGETLEYLPL